MDISFLKEHIHEVIKNNNNQSHDKFIIDIAILILSKFNHQDCSFEWQ